MHRLELCWTDRKSELSPNVRQKLRNTNSRLITTEEVSVRKLSEIIESQHEELHCAQAEELQQRDQQLLHERLLQQNWDSREAHQKSLNETEELKKFQSSTFDTMARRKLIEDQNTIMELSGRLQELQNEVNCMNDSKDFQDAESVRSGQSHVASPPVLFPPHGGMLSRSLGMPNGKMGRQVFGTHMVYQETFLQIKQRLLQHLIRKNCINGIHQSKSRSIHPQWRKE